MIIDFSFKNYLQIIESQTDIILTHKLVIISSLHLKNKGVISGKPAQSIVLFSL